MSKKAVLIGINYFGSGCALRGCQNDVDSMHEILVKTFGFLEENITILKDSRDDWDHKLADCPTRANVLAALNKLVAESASGDTLFVHYSGHGSHTKDKNGDEKDGEDEMICTVDDSEILDDELNEILVKKLPEGVKLRCLFDSCHSGSVLDLPFSWNFLDRVRIENDSQSGLDKDCLMISGCKDSQTSSDAWISGNAKYEGAMTWAFIESLKNTKILGGDEVAKPLWRDFIAELRQLLKKGRYDQVPQLDFGSKKLAKRVFDL